MKQQASNFMYPTLAGCCSKYYSWILESCLAAGTGPGQTPTVGSNKWYVDWSVSLCVKDCIKSNLDPGCGGLASSYEDPSFNTKQQCCSTKLWWKLNAGEECGPETESPTTSPTETPTESPTEYPTESPTPSPTISPPPTDYPTESPTEYPTESPTESPTEYPTESPTSSPTDSPTIPPPTESPTEYPTENPTESPTDYPTESPTPNPTDSPTESPTEYPTESPTISPPPTDYPTESPTSSPTDSPTEYPTESPTEYPTESPTNGPPFYPDWTGSDTCVNDRKTPQYMLANPAQWLYYTIEACCDRYYQFKKDECINNANPSGSNMWYVDWDSEMCVKDCASSSSDLNCGGFAKSWDPLYDTAGKCCGSKLSWKSFGDCVPDGASSGSSGGTSSPSNGSGKYYVNWSTNMCYKDCAVSTNDPNCGGLAKSWDPLYNDAAQCCGTKLSWVDPDDCTVV